MGVQRDPQSGRVISFSNAGSAPGYSANVQYYPCTGTVWALMANGDGGTGEGLLCSAQGSPAGDRASRHAASRVFRAKVGRLSPGVSRACEDMAPTTARGRLE